MNEEEKPNITPPTPQVGVEQPVSQNSPAQQATAEEKPPAEPSKAGRIIKKVIASIISWIVIPILIVLLVHNFIFQAFYVSGTSMVPTFNDGDYLVISKIDTTLSNFKRLFGSKKGIDATHGEVIVFRYPLDPNTFFVKRVIGLPGDRVVVKDGKVTIFNTDHPGGLVLNEKYIQPGITTEGNIDVIVKPDTFFVMGDNRTTGGSYDSREWGALPQKDVIGRAELRLLPVSNFGIISDPTY